MSGAMTNGAAAIAEADLSGQRYEMSPDLVTLVDNRPQEAEAIRTVRTHIIARHLRDGRRGLAMCGAGKGSGVTFTAANLAVSLAQVGVATLLIDGDLRDPQLETFIRPQQGAVTGLRQCVADAHVEVSDYIHPEVIPNLSLLYSGGVAPNPQEILGGDGFRRLMERCLRDFEFTIIDTPPANNCADGLRIASMIGYALVVAKANVTRVRDIADLAEQLKEDGARVVGTVLSEV